MSDYTLHLGDCLEYMRGMEDGAVDAVVFSPPYNLVKEWSGGGPNSTMKSLERRLDRWYDDEMPEEQYQSWQKNILRECMRICSGSVFYNHKVRYAHSRRGAVYHPWDIVSGFPVWTELMWDRRWGQGGNSGRWIIGEERIYQLGRPKVWAGGEGTNIWRVRPDVNGEHPCSFPVEIPIRCIRPTTSPGDTIFDPFMGSGTTGVACMQLGRNFIGCEIDPDYYAIAEKRISEAAKQPPLFTDAPKQPAPKQPGMWDTKPADVG